MQLIILLGGYWTVFVDVGFKAVFLACTTKNAECH